MQVIGARKSDIAYLTDTYEELNVINQQLQVNIVTLVKCKTVISPFIRKVKLFKQNIDRRDCYQAISRTIR